MLGDFDIRSAVLIFVSIVLCITVHEFGHAIVADKLGDDTPRRHGRISLNPLLMMKEYPVGSLLMPLIGAINGFMFGWAATPVNVSKVRRNITLRKAQLLITGAGPAFNVLFGIVCSGLFVLFSYLLVRQGMTWVEPLRQLSLYMVMTNVVLAVFNMIPVAPLDGFTIFSVLFGDKYPKAVDFMQKQGMVLIILVFIFGGRLISPVINVVLSGLFGLTTMFVA